MSSFAGYGYLAGTVLSIVYSQSVIRWRLSSVGSVPESFSEKAYFLLLFLLDPWVLSAVLGTFFSGLFWILSLTKFELSYAYPWLASVFILMMLVGVVFFEETFSLSKMMGTFLVVFGLVIASR